MKTTQVTERCIVRNEKRNRGIFGKTECGNSIYYCFNDPSKWDKRICPKCGKTMIVVLDLYDDVNGENNEQMQFNR